MEKLLGLEVGRKYSFKGIKPEDGRAEVTEFAGQFNIYWAIMRRKGWHDGKLFPFDRDGIYIGAMRWGVPDLEFDLGPIEGFSALIEQEIPVEEELPVEQELELGEQELKL